MQQQLQANRFNSASGLCENLEDSGKHSLKHYLDTHYQNQKQTALTDRSNSPSIVSRKNFTTDTAYEQYVRKMGVIACQQLQENCPPLTTDSPLNQTVIQASSKTVSHQQVPSNIHCQDATYLSESPTAKHPVRFCEEMYTVTEDTQVHHKVSDNMVNSQLVMSQRLDQSVEDEYAFLKTSRCGEEDEQSQRANQYNQTQIISSIVNDKQSQNGDQESQRTQNKFDKIFEKFPKCYKILQKIKLFRQVKVMNLKFSARVPKQRTSALSEIPFRLLQLELKSSIKIFPSLLFYLYSMFTRVFHSQSEKFSLSSSTTFHQTKLSRSKLRDAFDQLGLLTQLAPFESMFLSHSIASFGDLILLNREDLIEMGLPIGVRNLVMEAVQRHQPQKQDKSGIKVMELMMNSIVQISNGQKGTSQKQEQQRTVQTSIQAGPSVQAEPQQKMLKSQAQQRISQPPVAASMITQEESLILSRTESCNNNTRLTSVNSTRSTTMLTSYYQRQKDLKAEVTEVLQELQTVLQNDRKQQSQISTAYGYLFNQNEAPQYHYENVPTPATSTKSRQINLEVPLDPSVRDYVINAHFTGQHSDSLSLPATSSHKSSQMTSGSRPQTAKLSQLERAQRDIYMHKSKAAQIRARADKYKNKQSQVFSYQVSGRSAHTVI